MCPECHKRRLAYLRNSWTEPHGEQCKQEWWECPGCGAKFDESELEKIYGTDYVER